MLTHISRRSLTAVVVFFISAPFIQSAEIEVGATIRLVDRYQPDGLDKGIPGHPGVGDRKISARLPSGSTAVVKELGGESHQNWIRASTNGSTHWIVTKYVASVESLKQEGLAYLVGCWNLEHFKKGAERGFPEYKPTYNPPGPRLPGRTDDQIAEIAATVAERLNIALLVLCEINGKQDHDEDGDVISVSEELDQLLSHFPDGWNYVIGQSGGTQRVAFLYDTSRFRLNEVIEFDVPYRRIQGKDIFVRDPIAAHVTLLENGTDRNDLVIVGLHLASGQDKNRNHDAAMEKLLGLLTDSQADNELGGPSEHDILVMGDFNANMFRPPAERFFVKMDDAEGNWDVLAGNDYPATRLSGSPLKLRSSQIDYIIASRKTQGGRNGLIGDEVTASAAKVHTELLQWKPPAKFRKDLSDHLPVTVAILLVDDQD